MKGANVFTIGEEENETQETPDEIAIDNCSKLKTTQSKSMKINQDT